MADYDPKTKVPASWRGLPRRFPRSPTRFQIALLTGFVSLLILRSSIGIRNYNIIAAENRAMLENEMNGNLDLSVEPKRYLAQQVKESNFKLDGEPVERVQKKDGEILLSEEEVEKQILDEEADDAEVVSKMGSESQEVKNIKEVEARLVENGEDPETQVSEEDVDELEVSEKLGKDRRVRDEFRTVEAEFDSEEAADALAQLENVGQKAMEVRKERQDEEVVELHQVTDREAENVENLEKEQHEEKSADRQVPQDKVDDPKKIVKEEQSEEHSGEGQNEQTQEGQSEQNSEGQNEQNGDGQNAENVEETSEEEKKVPEVLTEEMLQEKRRQAMEDMANVTRRNGPDPFVLGPKISDWDEQRSAWLDKNPHMKTTDPHRPKVLLLTGSQPKPCSSPVGDHYLLKMIKNKVDYARIHNIDVYYNFAYLDKPMTHYWAKLPLIRKMMLTHPESEWIFWMDSDAMFTDMVFEIPFEKYDDYNLVMWGYDSGIYEERSWVACNTGVFFVRNNQWTLDLLDLWVHMGPEGEIRDEAGKILTTFLTNRPDMMADDQSALVFLMLTEGHLKPKIKLEWEYWLSGYWAAIIDRYEEYMVKSHPGAGGSDFPFTTHFTGCQPCTGLNNPIYASQKCLSGMERAFNFADNQILRSFGFEHEHLESSIVKRYRNESSDPLETVPTNNPWAVGSFYFS